MKLFSRRIQFAGQTTEAILTMLRESPNSHAPHILNAYTARGFLLDGEQAVWLRNRLWEHKANGFPAAGNKLNLILTKYYGIV